MPIAVQNPLFPRRILAGLQLGTEVPGDEQDLVHTGVSCREVLSELAISNGGGAAPGQREAEGSVALCGRRHSHVNSEMLAAEPDHDGNKKLQHTTSGRTSNLQQYVVSAGMTRGDSSAVLGVGARGLLTALSLVYAIVCTTVVGVLDCRAPGVLGTVAEEGDVTAVILPSDFLAGGSPLIGNESRGAGSGSAAIDSGNLESQVAIQVLVSYGHDPD